jgi:hypothetical protein
MAVGREIGARLSSTCHSDVTSLDPLSQQRQSGHNLYSTSTSTPVMHARKLADMAAIFAQ